MSSAFLKTSTAEETQTLAFQIAQYARPGDIYCLEGPLGAGKTVFAQGFARGLGIEEEITSPSFPIIQHYEHVPPLYHFDFYRLSGADEVREMGADELFLGSGISLIEWPDRAAGLLPGDAITIHIDIDGEAERRINISADSERIQELYHAIS